jgi:hypothetical protein
MVNEVVDTGKSLPQLGFPEFTSKLISDVFDALVSSMIRQQEAYADLLEKVAKTIEDFEAQEVAGEEVDDWLAEQFPGATVGETVIEENYEITLDDEQKLNYLLGDLAGELNITLPTNGDTLDATAVENIKKLVRRKLAKGRFDALQQLVAMGVVRIVVETGMIKTKLDFTVQGGEYQTSRYTNYRNKAWGISGRASFTRKLFGISAGGGIRSLNVSTYTRQNTAYTSAKIDIGAEVVINIRGDYQPLNPVE